MAQLSLFSGFSIISGAEILFFTMKYIFTAFRFKQQPQIRDLFVKEWVQKKANWSHYQTKIWAQNLFLKKTHRHFLFFEPIHKIDMRTEIIF